MLQLFGACEVHNAIFTSVPVLIICISSSLCVSVNNVNVTIGYNYVTLQRKG